MNHFDEEYYDEVSQITDIWQCGRRKDGASKSKNPNAFWGAAMQSLPYNVARKKFRPFASRKARGIRGDLRDAYYSDPTRPIEESLPLGTKQVRSILDYKAGVVTDDGVAMLAQGCPKLRNLYLDYRPLVTEAACSSLVPHCIRRYCRLQE